MVAGLLALGLFLVGTAAVPLLGRDESRFAEAAREMLANGELVVPSFGGLGRYDKPILIYWCTMASYALFGVSEGAARLPSGLAATLAVAVLAWTARRRWGEGFGLLAGMLLALTVTFHVQARACTADMVMMLPALLAMLAMPALSDDRGSWRPALLLWVTMGLAILAKGPVAPATALATAVALWARGRSWRGWEIAMAGLLMAAGWWRLGPLVLVVPAVVASAAGGREVLRRLRWGWGVPLLVALVLPWAAAAYIKTGGEFFRIGVGHHVVRRSLSALESHGGFPGFYLVTGIVAAFPWFALVPSALAGLRSRMAKEPWLGFQVAWLVGPWIMLELVQTKLVHYWMLSYPAGILLVTAWLAGPGRTARLPGSARALLLAGGLVFAALPPVAAWHLDLGVPVSLGVTIAAVMLIGTGWAVLLRQRAIKAVAGLLVATAAYLVLLLGFFLPRLGAELVGPRAASQALQLRRPSETIVVYKARDDELFFYLPLSAINCRAQACLGDRISLGEPFLGIARERDLGRFRDQHPSLELTTVGLVEGVDLGHGRRTRIALFRPAPASAEKPMAAGREQ